MPRSPLHKAKVGNEPTRPRHPRNYEYAALCHIRLAVRRLARIIVIEKALEDRLEIIEAKTRAPGSAYYQINPSGRVPYLVDDAGIGMEDSQLICAFLGGLMRSVAHFRYSGVSIDAWAEKVHP